MTSDVTPRPARRDRSISPARAASAAYEPRPLLSRAMSTIVPLGAIAALSATLIAGQLLRDKLEVAQLAGATAAIVLAIAGMVWRQHRERRTPGAVRADLRLHVAVIVALTILLVGCAAAASGLQSPYLTGLVLASGYAGLTLPPRISAALAALMTAALIPLAIVKPDATWLQAFTLLMLVPAGRGFGVLSSRAHRRAERVAQQLTRDDRLTRTLSRQGFLEELTHALATLHRSNTAVALFLIDLDHFKEINSARGGAGGDELLAWCGQRLAELLPPSASAGRLGGDEFGVATVGMDRLQADRFAVQLRDALGERHAVSIGYATTEDSSAPVSDLLRVGNAALRRAKQDRERHIHGLVSGGLLTSSVPQPPAPVLTYARLRRAGGRPQPPNVTTLIGTLASSAIVALGALGAMLGLLIAATDAAPPTFWGDLVRYGWLPWAIACFTLAYVARGREHPLPIPAVNGIVLVATALAGGGIGAAALALGDGVSDPLMAGIALRVLFDSSVTLRQQARITLLGTTVYSLVVIAFGPASSLWAAPFHLTLVLSAYAIGRVTHDGFVATTEQWLQVARTDVLTGLPNRFGVEADAAAVLHDAALSGERIAVVGLDIDGMRAFNDQHGHPAGDAAIVRLARVLERTFPNARLCGRLGADEFVALVPVLAPNDGDRLAYAIEAVLESQLPVSAGVAVFPEHGRDLDGLLHVADVRRRSTKAARRHPATRAA